MTQAETKSFQELAGRAVYLARLLDQKHISETEYIDRLNDLRRQHGLWPINPGAPTVLEAVDVSWLGMQRRNG
jgi:hypothetical protein